MSQKISSKNLQYDTTLPPFLARLRGQAASSGDGPDPLLVRNRRHARPRSGSAEAEDAPLVVDEEGNAVAGLRVGADGVVTEEETRKRGEDGVTGNAEDGEEKRGAEKEKELKESERVAGIGAGRKRKVGKVVGAEEEQPAEDGDGSEKSGGGGPKAAPPAKKKKKAKKIKLSFGDDDG